MEGARRKAGPGTKLAYGVGSVAYGVKNNGFDYFLLIFYSQVLGVDAPLVGAALLIALLVDAVSDPIVGYISDNTRSPLGRRHFYMYGAAIPVAIAYYFLWNPPAGLAGNDLFPYLVGMAILIRVLITLYEVPSSALAAELTDDYDQRTSILSYRYFFGWVGGTGMAAIALTAFMTATPDSPNGLMNVRGYSAYGMAAAIVICLSILIASLGTHSYIPQLRSPPDRGKLGIGRAFREIFETVSDRSFLALFGAALFGAVATGVSGGLSFYINGFFWEFSTDQIAVLSLSIIVSAMLALVLAPALSKTVGKKTGAIAAGVAVVATLPAPVALRLFGVFPENGDAALFPIILCVSVIGVALIITLQILLSSMIADLVEANEVKTARRSEGVFFAAITFVQKTVQGIGVLSASFILAAAKFPTGVAPGAVPGEALFRLGALYAPTLIFAWAIMVVFLRAYSISRDDHIANLRRLGGAR